MEGAGKVLTGDGWWSWCGATVLPAHKTQTEPYFSALQNSYKCGEETISASPSSHTNMPPSDSSRQQEGQFSCFSSEVNWGELGCGLHRFSIREHRTWPHHLHFPSLLSAREIIWQRESHTRWRSIRLLASQPATMAVWLCVSYILEISYYTLSGTCGHSHTNHHITNIT